MISSGKIYFGFDLCGIILKIVIEEDLGRGNMFWIHAGFHPYNTPQQAKQPMAYQIYVCFSRELTAVSDIINRWPTS